MSRTPAPDLLTMIRRQPWYIGLNLLLFGLALGCGLAILTFVWHEFNYDKHHQHAKEGRLYRFSLRSIEQRGTNLRGALSPPPYAPIFKKEFPDLVESIARARRKDTDVHYGSPIVKSPTHARSEPRFYWVDPTFFDVFTVDFIAGDPKTALVKPDTVVLTRSSAARYFGAENPIGKTLDIDDDAKYTVTGLVEDFPDDTHVHMDFMASMESVEDSRATYFIKNNYFTYVVLKPGVTPRDFQIRIDYVNAKYFDADLRKWVNFSMGDMAKNGNHLWFDLVPITNIHLTPHDFEAEQYGSAILVWTLFWCGIVIVFLAFLNFANLLEALDRAAGRAIRWTTAIGEGLVLGVATLVVTLAVALALMPFVSSLRTDQATLSLLDPGWLIPAAAAAAIGGALVASLIRLGTAAAPQVIARPLRTLFATAQVGAAGAVLVGALTVGQQIYFMQTKDLGMTKDRILVLKEMDGLRERMTPFKNELRNHASIVAVSDHATLPGRQFRGKSHSLAEHAAAADYLTLWQVTTDPGFADAYGLQVKEGRFFSYDKPDDFKGAVINETAARMLGLKLGTTIYEHSPGTPYVFTVIGVLKDFHVGSMRKEIAPVTIKLLNYQPRRVGRYISVRVRDDRTQEALAHIETVWKKFLPRRTVEYMTFTDDYHRLIAPELTTARILTGCAVLALLFSGWALVSAVLASTCERLPRSAVRRHLPLVVAATLLGMPVGYQVGADWLSGFFYRIEFGTWIPIATLMLTTGLAWLVCALLAPRMQRAITAQVHAPGSELPAAPAPSN